MQTNWAESTSSPKSVPLEVLENEWAQIFEAITNERTTPPKGWTGEEWEALCEKIKSRRKTSDDLVIADYIINDIAPLIKGGSDELYRLYDHIHNNLKGSVKILPKYTLEQPVESIEALKYHFEPISDLITLVGPPASGKTRLAWMFVAALKEIVARIGMIPDDPDKQEKFNESQEPPEYGKFLEAWKKEIGIFGVRDTIPQELKRSNAHASSTVEAVQAFTKNSPIEIKVLPARPSLRLKHFLQHTTQRNYSSAFLRRKLC